MTPPVREANHIPVMLERVVELLTPAFERPQPIYVDATLGLGGHAEAMLERFSDVLVLGIDRDPVALARAQQRLTPFGDRVRFVHAVYDDFADVVAGAGLSAVSGVLFDLGVSSMQLDLEDRGFAYARDVPLDMRMDQSQGLSAADVLNTYSAAELARILREYGEEKFASRIAAAIVTERDREPFGSSARLVELVRASIPAPARRTGGNPAKRTFQALRIEVNDELSVWHRALPAAMDLLQPGGRIVILAYHSLEDRIAKRVLMHAVTSQAPRDLPVVPPEFAPKFSLLTRGAERPTVEEVADNPRAKSVRLRAVERVAA